MKRRTFIKTSLKTATGAFAGAYILPSLGLGTSIIFQSCVNKRTKFIEETDTAFPLLEVEGTHYYIGYEIGNHFRDKIKLSLERRTDWFAELRKFVAGDKEKLYDRLLENTMEYFPEYHEELVGMADGSGVPFEDLFTLNIKAELSAKRSVLLDENPGCSTIHLVDNNRKYIFHNEDGNDAYSDLMFMVKATPPSGVSFFALCYPGLFIGNGPGLNNYGISQATNYIASLKFHEGIPRYVLNRAVLEAKTLDEAVRIATNKHRAFAYHHNLGSVSENKIISLEVTPEDYAMVETQGIYYHTNHLILDKTSDLPQDEEYVRSSSLSRFRVLSHETGKLRSPDKVSILEIMKILSSHENAPYSPCRHPDGDIKGRTLATAIIDITEGNLDIYKGNPCEAFEQGLVERYSFNNI